MQIVATLGIEGSDGLGCLPLAHSWRSLLSVSFSWSVVRSLIRMVRFGGDSYASRLIERRFRLSPRSSMPTWSTPPTRSRIDSPPSARPTQARTRALACLSAEGPALVSTALVMGRWYSDVGGLHTIDAPPTLM